MPPTKFHHHHNHLKMPPTKFHHLLLTGEGSASSWHALSLATTWPITLDESMCHWTSGRTRCSSGLECIIEHCSIGQAWWTPQKDLPSGWLWVHNPLSWLAPGKHAHRMPKTSAKYKVHFAASRIFMEQKMEVDHATNGPPPPAGPPPPTSTPPQASTSTAAPPSSIQANSGHLNLTAVVQLTNMMQTH